ncbi:N-acetylmuramoyl-L-alanine amidase [Nocardioides panacisoli]|uniref:N-acetylmuramoyl-L-alanine amidase n=2 Tax=Nocardioides panacisoli TaxID=627624 RepID=A0ABP7IUA5_9ACTN
MIMGISDSSLPRRDLARLTAAAVAVPTLGALAAPAPAGAAPGTRKVRLRPDRGSVVSAADVRLDGLEGTARTAGGLRTPVLETDRFSMLGVTWRSGTGSVRARVRRTDGRWSEWQPLAPLHDTPDHGSEEARHTPRATDLHWYGDADAVQLEVAGDAREPVLSLIDPGRRPEDAIEHESPRELADTDNTPRPHLLTRADWGADPRLRDGTQVVNKTMKQVHIHHTVNANDYHRRDVPALIRGMYRYHTQTLGWSDIGYNFLVDRFGRIWIGRKGSGHKIVRGAHTLGFNHKSMGVSVIGNFEVAKPNKDILRALVRLAAWRIDKYDLRPRGTVMRQSSGSDKYPAGTWVRLPVIDGHRDTNDTACPGRHLYAEIPHIRRAVHRRIQGFHS